MRGYIHREEVGGLGWLCSVHGCDIPQVPRHVPFSRTFSVSEATTQAEAQWRPPPTERILGNFLARLQAFASAPGSNWSSVFARAITVAGTRKQSKAKCAKEPNYIPPAFGLPKYNSSPLCVMQIPNRSFGTIVRKGRKRSCSYPSCKLLWSSSYTTDVPHTYSPFPEFRSLWTNIPIHVAKKLQFV